MLSVRPVSLSWQAKVWIDITRPGRRAALALGNPTANVPIGRARRRPVVRRRHRRPCRMDFGERPGERDARARYARARVMRARQRCLERQLARPPPRLHRRDNALLFIRAPTDDHGLADRKLARIVDTDVGSAPVHRPRGPGEPGRPDRCHRQGFGIPARIDDDRLVGREGATVSTAMRIAPAAAAPVLLDADVVKSAQSLSVSWPSG